MTPDPSRLAVAARVRGIAAAHTARADRRSAQHNDEMAHSSKIAREAPGG